MREDILAVFGLFFVMPTLAFAYAGLRAWLNKRDAIAPVPLSPALADRFDQLERQIETLALEVERLAEGQRFVSKVLVERPAPALAAGDDARAAREA